MVYFQQSVYEKLLENLKGPSVALFKTENYVTSLQMLLRVGYNFLLLQNRY